MAFTKDHLLILELKCSQVLQWEILEGVGGEGGGRGDRDGEHM